MEQFPLLAVVDQITWRGSDWPAWVWSFTPTPNPNPITLITVGR